MNITESPTCPHCKSNMVSVYKVKDMEENSKVKISFICPNCLYKEIVSEESEGLWHKEACLC